MPFSAFVSSTFVDLKTHRRLVCDALKKLEHHSEAMEFFGALPDTPKEECLQLVRTAGAYIGIFAMRYGSIDAESGKSLTELEYDEAQLMRLPSLIYLIDEGSHAVLPKHVDTGSTAERLRDLKQRLKESHVVGFFTSPEDLAAKVTQDLMRLVGVMEKKSTAQVLSQIAANTVKRHPLTASRFQYLKRRTSGVFNHVVPDSILRESLELTIAGDNMAAAFVLSRGTPMSLDDAVDGLMRVERTMLEILEGHQQEAESPKNPLARIVNSSHD